MYTAISAAHPLPCVLIATGMLDACVGGILRRYFIDGETSRNLLTDSQFLGTLRVRSDLAYCLGLIPCRVNENVRHLGTIRNLFAHSYLSMTFDDPQVIEECTHLKFPPVHQHVSPETGPTVPPPDSIDRVTRDSARNRFVVAATLTFSTLIKIGLATEHRKRLDSEWEPASNHIQRSHHDTGCTARWSAPRQRVC
jgi:DNA-binding MltR family transcriptional regulator